LLQHIIRDADLLQWAEYDWVQTMLINLLNCEMKKQITAETIDGFLNFHGPSQFYTDYAHSIAANAWPRVKRDIEFIKTLL
jgi:hypothetical protein